VIVEGNRRVDAETVRAYFHAGPDGRFDDAARDAALKALIATGLFDKVSIERAGERLVVHLSEPAVLDRVAFEGNRKVEDTRPPASPKTRNNCGFITAARAMPTSASHRQRPSTIRSQRVLRCASQLTKARSITSGKSASLATLRAWIATSFVRSPLRIRARCS